MEKRLIRKMPGKMIGGVAAGLAEYLDIDATIVRLLFVLATFFHGSGLLIYIVLWIAMPAAPDGVADPGQAGAGASPDTLSSPGVANSSGSESSGNRSAAVIGWILVGLGIFFLMDEFLEPWFRDFFYWFNFRRIWPVVFIIVGVLIISSATKKPTAPPADNPAPPADNPAPGGSGSAGTSGDPDPRGNPERSGDYPPPPSPGSPPAPESRPRVPGEGPLNGPDNNDKD